MRALNTFLFLVLSYTFVAGQDCQLAAMQVDIPAGVGKHHFPAQEMPLAFSADHFIYAANWNQGDLTIRIRFSKDGTTWTKWQVLKRDFSQPTATASPLNLSDQQYQYFEWAVFNKAGEASKLTFNFYHPIEEILYTNVMGEYAFEVSNVGCPQPKLAPIGQPSSPLVITQDEE